MDRKDLQKKLEIYRKNLAWLEEQRAKMGLDVTVRVLNEIEDTKRAIAELEGQLAKYAFQDDPHLCAHWEAVKKFVNAKRWLEVIPLLEHIRDTAPYFREEEVNRLLRKARETKAGRCGNATIDS